MKLIRTLTAASVALALAALPALAQDDDSGEPPPRGQSATVTIITDPAQSEVYLDGVSIGKTPINNLEVTSGRQRVVVMDQNQELVNKKINIWPGKDNKFEFKTQMPWGNIELTTTPDKCIVYVDGEQADATDGGPLTIRSLDAGDHLIETDCGKGRKGDTLVRVGGETTIKLHIDATKKKGKKKK
jgi:hypothetical protein